MLNVLQLIKKIRTYITLLLMTTLLSAVSLSYAATAAHAKKSAWDGSNASFGLNINSGNTNTQNVNTALSVIYTHNRWVNNASGQVQFSKDTGVLNKEKYGLQDQLNVGFDSDNINSLFANSVLTIDKFSPYDYVYTGAAGYARKLIHRDNFTLTAQFGPGFSTNRETDTKKKNSQFIMQTASDIEWKVSSWGTLSQNLTADFGKLYNHYISTSKFTNKITKHLAVQIAFNVDHYSTIPPTKGPDTKKTDTTTDVNLVYHF